MPAATLISKCPPNQPPATGPEDKTPYDQAAQVVRTQPISSTTTNNIAGLNGQVHAAIREANRDSVFLNYALVNVLWPNVNSPIGEGALAPLPGGSPQPPNQKVANTTMETYHQSLSCMQCHRHAAVAEVEKPIQRLKIPLIASPPTGDAGKASDYSFLFSNAKSSRKQR